MAGGRRLEPPARSVAKDRRPLHAAGIAALITRRGVTHGSSLDKIRGVVERTISWLHNLKKLRVRFECLAIIHKAFMSIVCCIIFWKQLKKTFFRALNSAAIAPALSAIFFGFTFKDCQ
jgi:hypothetical protein